MMLLAMSRVISRSSFGCCDLDAIERSNRNSCGIERDVLRSRRRSSSWLQDTGQSSVGIRPCSQVNYSLILLLQPLGQGVEFLLVDKQAVALPHDIVKVCLHLAILLAP